MFVLGKNNAFTRDIFSAQMQSVWKGAPNIDMDTPKSTRDYYFEDLRVGQHFETGTHTVSEDEIKTFAATFNPQPFHLDDQLARNTLILYARKLARNVLISPMALQMKNMSSDA